MPAQSFGRRTFLAGSAGALALSLAACAGSGATAKRTAEKKPVYAQPEGDVPAEYAKRQRVVAWTTWGSTTGAVVAELAKRFNESQSDIFLDLQSQNGTYDELAQKLAAGLQAKQIPDLAIFSEVTWHKFFLNDTLEPLDDYFTKSAPRAAYNSRLLDEGVLSGQLWWVPFARSTPLFYYNRDLFAQAGLPDRAPKTWSEMREWGAELKGITYNGNQPKMFAYPQVDGDWMFQGVLWNFGGGISKGLDITIDDAASIAAGEYERKLVADKLAYMATAPLTDFENGLIAAAEDSTGALGSVVQNSKFEVGTGFVPGEKSQEVPTGGGGFSIMANSSTSRKKAAFEFLSFLAKPEQAAYWTTSTGYMPVVDAAKKESSFVDLVKKNPNFEVAIKQMDKTKKEDDVRLFVPNANIALYEGLQQIWSKNASAKSVFADVAETLKRSEAQIRAAYESRVK